MKIVNQSAKAISGLSPMEHIEVIGRTCYKSEDRIEEGSAAGFVSMLYKNKHHAMLEHYRFIMEVSPLIYECISSIKHDYFQMTHSDGIGRDRYVISFSARALSNLVEDSDCVHYGYMPMAVAGVRDELIGHIVKAYDCYELFGWDRDKTILLSTGTEFIPNTREAMSDSEWEHHGWRSIHFITDRGISHELVRHRPSSFAQESTRYCNYSLDKFGKELTFIEQDLIGNHWDWWYSAASKSEECYFQLLDMGVTPQDARSVLPTCIKTELVITTNVKEWRYIYELRYKGTTGKPHPMMVKLMCALSTLDAMEDIL